MAAKAGGRRRARAADLPMSRAVMTTTLPLALMARGKVRDIYHLGERLLMVATDRISAFDVVLPTPIPDRGKVLTALSKWWFEVFQDIPSHVAEDQSLPARVDPTARDLAGRILIVDRLDMIPFECVARGYLAGAGWTEYRETGGICGVPLPPNLKEAERLPAPIFTPARKVSGAHDENVTFEQVVAVIGGEQAEQLRATTLDVYGRAADISAARGLILADTKLEFGVLPYDEEETPILADELLSPDSSRFWPQELWRPGSTPVSFDKQFVRQYLMQVDWDRTPPAPGLPEPVIRQTRQKYFEAYRRLTGAEFTP